MHGHTRLNKAEEIKIATLDDEHTGMLSELILCSWALTKVELQKDLQSYWSSRDEIATIDGTVHF